MNAPVSSQSHGPEGSSERGEGRPRFAADAMLGRLARYLRILGYNVTYTADIADRELRFHALRDRRILLTRDHELAETSLPIEVLLIESEDVAAQLRQVAGSYGLDDSMMFTRCIVCNAPLEEASRKSIEGDVPPYVYQTQQRFVRCSSCGRVYWPATHVERARARISSILDTVGGDGA